MTAEPVHLDYREEAWARRAAALSASDRLKYVTACSALLAGHDGDAASPVSFISDALYSELIVLLDVLQGEDPQIPDAPAGASHGRRNR